MSSTILKNMNICQLVLQLFIENQNMYKGYYGRQ